MTEEKQKAIEEAINKLNEALLPENSICDGAWCMGCWIDKVDEARQMLNAILAK